MCLATTNQAWKVSYPTEATSLFILNLILLFISTKFAPDLSMIYNCVWVYLKFWFNFWIYYRILNTVDSKLNMRNSRFYFLRVENYKRLEKKFHVCDFLFSRFDSKVGESQNWVLGKIRNKESTCSIMWKVKCFSIIFKSWQVQFMCITVLKRWKMECNI